MGNFCFYLKLGEKHDYGKGSSEFCTLSLFLSLLLTLSKEKKM